MVHMGLALYMTQKELLEGPGRLDEARNYAEQVITTEPSYADAHHLLGEVALQKKENIIALNCFYLEAHLKGKVRSVALYCTCVPLLHAVHSWRPSFQGKLRLFAFTSCTLLNSRNPS